MSALPRPDLPAGPHRDLVGAVHDLHHRAGWPSLRTLARSAGVSHTTVSKVFSSPALPTWGTLELLVEAMQGDVAQFHLWWLAATSPSSRREPTSVPRIAGRRAEIATIRRHLEIGSGLAVITGEAGIGKTTLAAAAAATSDTFVATGHCLPLSSDVPLSPLADALRAVMAVDEGRWFGEALAMCPSYVAGALTPILPELDGPDGGDASGAFARHRMLAAVGVILDALASLRPLAVLFEDLHWADDASLGLVEHFVARGIALPVIGTWRTEDPDVAMSRVEWWARVRRNPAVTAVPLGTLGREETAEQLRLATGSVPDEAHVEWIHALGQGLPLYTDQLADAADGEVPPELADLLDLRLGQLDAESWSVARSLGVAERPLTSEALHTVCALTEDAYLRGLAGLVHRRLVRTSASHQVCLSHPLFVEAIRRRMLPGEATKVHALVAETLARQGNVEPAEVAHHWQHAGRPDQEVLWQVAAARRARERHAALEALDRWHRVLQLSSGTDLRPGIEDWEVLCGAMDAAWGVPDTEAALTFAQQALALDLEDGPRVRVLERAGNIYCYADDLDTGLTYLDEAADIVDRMPPSVELVDVLTTRIGNRVVAGRYDGISDNLRRASELLDGQDDGPRRRRVLMWTAFMAMVDGDNGRALELIQAIDDVVCPEPDPISDLVVAVNATAILLDTAATPLDVAKAAAGPLAQAAAWRLEHHQWATLLRANVAEAHLRRGDVRGASEVLQPDIQGTPTRVTAGSHLTFAAAEVRRGLVVEALDRCRVAEAQFGNRDANWAETVPCHAEVELWAGHADASASRLEEALAITLPTDSWRAAAPALALCARAHADLLDQRGSSTEDRRDTIRRLERIAGQARSDPFGPRATGAHVPAWALTWQAELTRVEQVDGLTAWTAAASAWTRLDRPHDAAYCHWRAAQAARQGGQGTTAARLLRRAATKARDHVPLLRAITGSASSVSSRTVL